MGALNQISFNLEYFARIIRDSGITDNAKRHVATECVVKFNLSHSDARELRRRMGIGPDEATEDELAESARRSFGCTQP